MPAPNAPEDALDLLRILMDVAADAKREGWTVNLAVDTGRMGDSLTFAATRRPQPEPA